MRRSEENDFYLKQLNELTFKPVFILGLHRSGTSLLYEILNATGCFNVVTAYHILNFDRLISNHINGREKEVKEEIRAFLKKYSQLNRGIDELIVTPDFPEEYGFILTNGSYPWRLTKRNLSIFKELCGKIQFINKADKPILLKNPFDFSNFLFIKKEFPDSRFIFIHRHPIRVINSFIRAMQTLFNDRNPYTTLLFHLYDRIFDNPLLLYTARFHYASPLGVIQVTLAFARAIQYFLRNIFLLDDRDYIEVRYEDLCEKPMETISKVLDFLDLKVVNPIDYEKLIKPRKVELLPTVDKLKPFITRKMQPYLSHCGYEGIVI